MRALTCVLGILAVTGCGEPAGRGPEPATSEASSLAAPTPEVTSEGPQDDHGSTMPANYPATSSCAETEPTLFRCRIRDGRTIAVCVQHDKQGREFAQYRFGEGDAPPELAWPQALDAHVMQWASVPYSGGGETQLSFARGDVRYVVYSRVVRTNFAPGKPNDPEFEDGAYVYRGEKRISSLPCDGPADRPVSVAMAERFAEQQDGLFTD